MAMTNLVNDNEAYIKDALENGINGEAIESVINNMASSVEKPSQIKEVVESISNMKQAPSMYNEQFLSDFVRKNNGKIESAIKEGLTPNEIAMSLESDLKQDTYDSKNHLKFMTRLISEIKKIELKLIREKEQAVEYQKVYNN
ncbi:MAG: hypothetical protein Q4E75_02110 [bacterium]|nr:hypothetical protein [bacterium]